MNLGEGWHWGAHHQKSAPQQVPPHSRSHFVVMLGHFLVHAKYAYVGTKRHSPLREGRTVLWSCAWSLPREVASAEATWLLWEATVEANSWSNQRRCKEPPIPSQRVAWRILCHAGKWLPPWKPLLGAGRCGYEAPLVPLRRGGLPWRACLVAPGATQTSGMGWWMPPPA